MPATWTRRSFLATSVATLAATKLNAAPAKETLVYIGSTAKGEGAAVDVGGAAS